MTKKELTHIYHGIKDAGIVSIGSAQGWGHSYLELFEKALVLTADLKRLPYLLGGKIFITYDSHILIDLIASGLVGMGFTIVLLNGTYDAGEFQNFTALMDNERAKDDILMVLHGSFHSIASTQAGNVINVPISHWDFEGKKILYDTLTLMSFLDADTNVATASWGGNNIRAAFELEIDWQPLNKAEMMEFLMEHIYAKQGD